MAENVVLTAGAWRNTARKVTVQLAESVKNRKDKGYGLMPYEVAIAEMSELLDACDTMAEEFLMNREETPILSEA